MEIRDITVFIVGFFSAVLLFYIGFYSDFEVPFGTGMVTLNESSPSDRVRTGDIILEEDRIILNVPGASLSRYASTGSMRPLLDTGANGIRIVPENVEDIGVGDIISFRRGELLIVHRVVGVGIDEEGDYLITQGDNELENDGKVRFSEVEFVTIGVIW